MPIPKTVLDKMRNLKPLGGSALRLIKIIHNPEHTLQEVMRVVETDPVLTGRILRVVNSAAFGLRTPISTLSRAITFLGDETVLGLVLDVCAAQLYHAPLEGYESESGELWQHSLQTAIAAQEIAQCLHGRIPPDIAYTAGLLHDIGKVPMSSALIGHTRDLVRNTDAGGTQDYLAAEREALGTDHCEVGAGLAKQWGLPQPLMSVIEHHHRPAAAEEEQRALVYAVHIGDWLAMMSGSGTGADSLLYVVDDHYADYFQLSHGDMEGILLRSRQKLETILTAMAPGV